MPNRAISTEKHRYAINGHLDPLLVDSNFYQVRDGCTMPLTPLTQTILTGHRRYQLELGMIMITLNFINNSIIF